MRYRSIWFFISSVQVSIISPCHYAPLEFSNIIDCCYLWWSDQYVDLTMTWYCRLILLQGCNNLKNDNENFHFLYFDQILFHPQAIFIFLNYFRKVLNGWWYHCWNIFSIPLVSSMVNIKKSKNILFSFFSLVIFCTVNNLSRVFEVVC